MVPPKTWISENFGRISKSPKRFSEVSKSRFAMVCIYSFSVYKLFNKQSRDGISNQDLGLSASLGFYHSPPLNGKYMQLKNEFISLVLTFQVSVITHPLLKLYKDMFSLLYLLIKTMDITMAWPSNKLPQHLANFSFEFFQ